MDKMICPLNSGECSDRCSLSKRVRGGDVGHYMSETPDRECRTCAFIDALSGRLGDKSFVVEWYDNG